MATTDAHEEGRNQVGERLIIWPSRSLGRSGSRALPTLVAAIFAAVALWAARSGAWPVAIYAILAAVGFACALSSNNRAARLVQEIEFADGRIRVRTHGPAVAKPIDEEFNPYWVRVVEHRDRHGEPHIMLEQSGRRLPIGGFLGPDERHRLAQDLRTCIARCRADKPRS